MTKAEKKDRYVVGWLESDLINLHPWEPTTRPMNRRRAKKWIRDWVKETGDPNNDPPRHLQTRGGN